MKQQRAGSRTPLIGTMTHDYFAILGAKRCAKRCRLYYYRHGVHFDQRHADQAAVGLISVASDGFRALIDRNRVFFGGRPIRRRVADFAHRSPVFAPIAGNDGRGFKPDVFRGSCRYAAG